jgi:hypothetical protein
MVLCTVHAHLLLSAATMPALLRSTLLLFLKSTASWGRLLMTSHCRGGPKQGTCLCSEMSPVQWRMQVPGVRAASGLQWAQTAGTACLAGR